MACIYKYNGIDYNEDEILDYISNNKSLFNSTKTRLVYEVQSDLFQKGRDNKTLTTPDSKLIEDLQEGFQIGALDTQTYNESLDNLTNETSNPQNQFLQLLNKDGNWINFFIKSIVNDSIKRGYEEVWFPSGDTASKVEGHSTLSEMIENKRTYQATQQKELENLNSILADMEGYEEGILKELAKAQELEKFEKEKLDTAKHSLDTIDVKDLPQDQYLNRGAKPETKHDYLRIRENYWNREYKKDSTETLTKDNYDGYVLQEYTIGKESTITKITPEEFKRLSINYGEPIREIVRSYELAVSKAKTLIRELQDIKSGETKKEFQDNIAIIKERLEGVQKEIDDINSGGIEKIAPIASFYEKRVKNILEKTYPSTEVTDEYGNKWNKVDLKNIKPSATKILFNKLDTKESFRRRAKDLLLREGIAENAKVLGEDTIIVSREDNTAALTALENINESYYSLHGLRPYYLNKITDRITQIGIDDSIVQYNNIQDSKATANAKQLLDTLSEKKGIQGELISSEQAQELTSQAKIAWEGEPAFFLNGKVYIVQDRLNNQNVLHEFSHPFISMLANVNPNLYNNLFDEFKSSGSQAIEDIFTDVRRLYPELEENSLDFMNEVFVRILTANAEKKLAENKNLKGVFNRLWFAIKQAIRSIFGQKVTLDNLSENTTLDELSNMLLFSNEKLVVEASDYPLFNREMAKELEQLDQAKVIQDINFVGTTLAAHLRKLSGGHYKELREVLKNESDANIVLDASKLIKEAQKLEGDINEQTKMLSSFAQAIMGVNLMSKKMREFVETFESKAMDEQDQLRVLTYYGYIISDWGEVLTEMSKTNTKDFPLLMKEVTSAQNNFTKITDYTNKIYKKGLVSVLRDQFGPLKEFVDKVYPEQIDKYQKAYDAGDKTLGKKLTELKEEYKRFNLDDETILSYINGKMGDANPFSSFFQSFSSNTDPVVAGFGVLIEKTMAQVEGRLQKYSTLFRNELGPLYDKFKVDRSDPEKLGKQLVFVDEVFSRDKDKNPKRVKVHMFLNEYSGSWLYEYKEQEDKIQKAKDSGDKEALTKAMEDFDDFKEKYFHREYKDEIYEAKKFWKRSDLHKEADKRRKEITGELRRLQSYTIKDDETIEKIDFYLKQLKSLASVKNLDGSAKVDTVDNPMLSIAKIIQEYQELTRTLYDEYEIKGAFSRAMKVQEDSLLDEGLVKDSPDYNKALSSWIKQNTRVVLTTEFYDTRQKILDKVTSILEEAAANRTLDQDALDNIQRLKEFTSNSWKEIIQQVKGFRDKDGQPIGTELSKEKIAEIKRLQEETIKAQDEIRHMNDLTIEEQDFVDNFITNINSGIYPSQDDSNKFQSLMDKQNLKGLSKTARVQLLNAFEELRMFQSKIPTDYYLDIYNEKIKEIDPTFTLTMENVNDTLLAESMSSRLAQDSEFKSWFLANHILRSRWNAAENTIEEYYERVFAWNRIIPNIPAFKNAISNNDYRGLLTINSPYVKVKWASKYYFYRVKDEYKNERKVGLNVDNRGNWLPKTREQGAYVDQNGISKFENTKYFQLKNSTDEKDKQLFSILEVYKKHFLKIQDETHDYTKLWYEIPRIRQRRLETIGNIVGDTKNSLSNMLDWAKNAISPKPQADALDNGQLTPEDLQKEYKMYVMTDLLGNEIQSIPMKFMSPLEAEYVSMDVGRSILKYAAAVETNKAMHDINPIAQALKKVLKEEGITDINKMGRVNWLGKLIPGSPKVKDKNVRLQAIINMTDRHIHGIESKMELGLFGNKIATHMMGLAAKTSLALNIPAAIKNLASARIANVLESISQDNFTTKDWKEASITFLDKFMPAFFRDYNKFSDMSLQTQLFEVFDAIQGNFLSEIGEEFSASIKKDVVNWRVLTSGQKFGELNAQGSAAIAMLKNQKVPIEINGVVTQKPYLEVWIKKADGTIGVEDGVPAEWDINGKKFLEFKIKLHKVNELIQGAYAPMNQPEMSRYTTGKLAGFMRRYFVPGVMKRMGVKRAEVALGSVTEGHYRTFIKHSADYIINRKNHWHLLTPSEKRNVWRTLGEIGYALTFTLLISALGYNGDDKDKNKRLKEMSWAHTMLLYELMMIKSEVETFLPLPYLGMNELLRMKDQPSIAFPIMNKFYKLLIHSGEWLADPFVEEDISHYNKKTGIYDKGDLKLKADLLKILGYSGATLDPAQGIKNFNAGLNKYN